MIETMTATTWTARSTQYQTESLSTNIPAQTATSEVTSAIIVGVLSCLLFAILVSAFVMMRGKACGFSLRVVLASDCSRTTVVSN